jgi:hypothetical protein
VTAEIFAAAASAVAATAGTTLVEAAVTDAWESVKARFVKLLGRGDREQEREKGLVLEHAGQVVQAASDQDRPQVIAAQSAVIEEFLLRTIMEDNALLEQVQQLTAELRTDWPSRSQIATASDNAQQAVQYYGVQTNTFGNSTGNPTKQ